MQFMRVFSKIQTSKTLPIRLWNYLSVTPDQNENVKHEAKEESPLARKDLASQEDEKVLPG